MCFIFQEFTHNLSGIVIANGIVSPAVALTKLSFYLWELGYVDENGREAIERFSEETNDLVNNGQLGAAFDHFLSLGEYINEIAGAVAVNLGHIVEKLPRDARQGYPLTYISYCAPKLCQIKLTMILMLAR